MLILSRLKDQSIILTVPPSNEDTRIEVVVTEIKENKVRLGIATPIKVRVIRNELVNEPVDYHNISPNKLPLDDTHKPMNRSSTEDIVRRMRRTKLCLKCGGVCTHYSSQTENYEECPRCNGTGIEPITSERKK